MHSFITFVAVTNQLCTYTLCTCRLSPLGQFLHFPGQTHPQAHSMHIVMLLYVVAVLDGLFYFYVIAWV